MSLLERLNPLDISNLPVEAHGLPMNVAALAMLERAPSLVPSGSLALAETEFASSAVSPNAAGWRRHAQSMYERPSVGGGGDGRCLHAVVGTPRVRSWRVDDRCWRRESLQGRTRRAKLDADTGEMYLAADVDSGFASAFRFSVSTTGEWWADTVVAVQRIDGGWDEPVSGGSHGDGWPTPWQTPLEGWDRRHLLIMGSTGLSIEVDEVERELLAVSGFAAGVVRQVRVEVDGGERLISPAPVGAFTVVTVGDGSKRLTPLNESGSAIGPAVEIPM